MKNLIIVIFTAFILVNCERCEDTLDEFVNNSGRDIEITSYKNNYPDIPYGTFSGRFSMVNGGSKRMTNTYCLPDTKTLDFVQLIGGDSIVIDFGDKKLFYSTYNNLSPRNPYLLFRNNANSLYFSYVLTEQDYLNAN